MGRFASLAVGFLFGGYARYFLAARVYQGLGTTFPYGTLAVNLSGCLAIGFLDALAESRALLGPEARLLLMTGFCGAYTTFSTLILETSNLLGDGQAALALVNYLGSGLGGLLLFKLGAALGRLGG